MILLAVTMDLFPQLFANGTAFSRRVDESLVCFIICSLDRVAGSDAKGINRSVFGAVRKYNDSFVARCGAFCERHRIGKVLRYIKRRDRAVLQEDQYSLVAIR